MINKKELEKIAIENGYKTVELLTTWKNNVVYAMCTDDDVDLIIGRPEFIIVEDDKPRLATDKEVWEILDSLNDEDE